MNLLQQDIKSLFPDITQTQYNALIGIMLALIHDTNLQNELWKEINNKEE